MDPKMGHGRHKSQPQGPQGGRIIQLDAGPTCRTTIQPFYGFISHMLHGTGLFTYMKGENDRRVETIHYMEHLGMDSY